MKIMEKQAYEERIQTLLHLQEANYRAYEELDKKAHEFSEWLETRRREHQKTSNIFAGSECYAIQQKFDDLFFSVEAIASVENKNIKEDIYKLIEEEPGIRTSAIIERLPYPCIDIIEALDELKDEDQVESNPIQVTGKKWSNNPNKTEVKE